MAPQDIRRLCDVADEQNPKAYAALCEEDTSDEEFILRLCALVDD